MLLDFFWLTLFYKLGGPVGVDKVIQFCSRKFPKPSDQDRGMRAAFEALDKDGYVYFTGYSMRYWIFIFLLFFYK